MKRIEGDVYKRQDVVPQQFMSELYKACSGISYIDIKLFTTADAGAKPTDYPCLLYTSRCV